MEKEKIVLELTQKEAEFLRKFLDIETEDLDFTGCLETEESDSLWIKIKRALGEDENA